MNSAEIIIKILENEGVEYIFGIPGGAIEDMNTAIYNSKEIKAIVTKHEEGAAFMADAYARVSGKFGVCCATAGPGASNLITGIATSYADGIPVCALTGQVATSVFGKGAIQESGAEGINMTVIFRNFTKYSGMVINENRTQYMIEKAIRMANTSPTGPVHLNLPTDIMKRDIPVITPCSPRSRGRLFDREEVEKAALMLSFAQKPAIIAGWGVALSKGAKELLELAQLLNIPVATSPKAKGIFPETHPLSLGVLGFAGSPVAKEYILQQEVDVLLAVGTSFNEMATSGWDQRLLPTKDLIHIDVNAEKIGRNYYASASVVGDAKAILKEMVYAIKQKLNAKADEVFLKDVLLHPGVERLRAKHASAETEPETGSKLYHPRHLVSDIQKSFPKDTIYFSDMGAVMAWAIRHMVLDKPYSFFMCMGFGGMGYATAAPVGARLASGEQPVVAMVGDGGFLMNGMEVAIAVNYDIPAIWIVFNNSMLGMVYHGRKLAENPIPEGIPSHFKRVDFAKLAEGFGAKGIKIENPGELTPALAQKVLASGQPTVIDVWIDEEAVPPIHSRIKTMDEHFEI